ncbi:MAG: M24 family metallopeptidase, partial [Chlamydiota bacterium]
HMQKEIKAGISEKELALIFEVFCLQNGAEAMAFDPIVAFGPNSAMPHYRSQDVPLCKGDIVLIDIGVVREKYHSDMTRVHFFQGADPEMQRLYAIARKAQRKALEHCRPGVRVGMLDEAARDVLRDEGVEELFVHSLGHGIGLETHEYPRIKATGESKDMHLEVGMAITVEPGLYIPGKGGVRYEDTVVITPNGYRNFYPEDDA